MEDVGSLLTYVDEEGKRDVPIRYVEKVANFSYGKDVDTSDIAERLLICFIFVC
jgi:ferritin-like protein